MYEEIAEVRIVSPEKLYIPRFENDSETDGITEGSPQKNFRETSSALDKGGLGKIEMGEGQTYMHNLLIGGNRGNADKGQSLSEWISPFRLGISSGGKSDFKLELGTKSKGAETIDELGGEPRGRLNFDNFYSGGLESLPFKRIKSRKNLRGGQAGRHGQSILAYTENYDISPWVKEVVNKIRDNWSVPPIKETLALGEVKIYISVGKTGELLHLEILNSSDLAPFDDTALEAIRSSLPFPPIPEEFPHEILEALLVFQFNE